MAGFAAWVLVIAIEPLLIASSQEETFSLKHLGSICVLWLALAVVLFSFVYGWQIAGLPIPKVMNEL